MNSVTRVTEGWPRTVAVALVGAMIVLSVCAPAAAATATDPNVTFVESSVTADTTWTPAEGPYRVIQDIEVESGATLTIAPGTNVEVAEDITVTVSGSLRANGTAARPVAITRSEGAAAARRWGTVRYNGTEGSALELQHTTLRGGTTGITVASDDGSVAVVDSTVRDLTAAGLAVAGTTATPPIAVRGSTFRGIGDHAIQASPGAGTTDRVSLTAAPDSIDAGADHTLALDPGVGVSFDSIRLTYGSDGSVASVGGGSIERIGVDRDRDGDVDRSISGSVASVSSTASRVEISFSDSVDVPADARLLVEYDDAVNPSTRGVYPVNVQLRDGGIPRTAAGIEAQFAVGGVPPLSGPQQPSTRVRGLSVLESTFRGIDGAGVFVAADRVRRAQASRNRIEGVAGSGIAVRAERSETFFFDNEITAAADGIELTADADTSVTATGNRIRNARTGIRVRQSGTDSLADGTVTLRRNRLTNNRGHGVGIRTESLELAVDAANNTIGDNGRRGISVDSWRVRRATLHDNGITGNADEGVSIRTDAAARGFDAADNTIADNGGHGLEVRSDLIVHGGRLADNRLTNNAGAGVAVSSPVTHRSNLSIADNVVAANAYGVVLRGVFGTTVRDNAIVFNTNRFADPVQIPGVEPGTGSYVAAGEAGVIIDQAGSDVPLSDLVADPGINNQLRNVTVGDGIVAVLRTDGSASTRSVDATAVRIRAVSADIPTGIVVPKTGRDNSSYRLTGNGVYGQERGLTVDVAPLVATNTTRRILTEPIRTVDAESNYWGSPHGPYHSSILPDGRGNAVVTSEGWVDFVPFRETPPDPAFTRPTAALDGPTAAPPGEEVRVSASGSTSTRGPVVRYHYRTDGTAQPASDVPSYTFEMPDRPVEVGLVVEDSFGIESNATAVTVEPGTATPSATPTPDPPGTEPAPTATTPASTPPPTPSDPSPTLLGSLSSVWGLLGGVLYLLALGFGSYGMALTVTDRSPPISGLRTQGLAAAGIGVWIVAGVLGGSPLLTLGLAAAVVWAALTGVAYVVATRDLLDGLLG